MLYSVDIVLPGITQWYIVLQGADIVLQAVTWC